jgi:ribokinase
MKPIVVVGSINVDLVTEVSRVPRPGETLTGTGFQLHSGGKGGNQAVAVARLGYPCTILGAVGDDVFGRDLSDNLQKYGVDTRHLLRVPGPSGTATIVVSSTAENSIIVTPGANAHVSAAYLEAHADVIRGAGIVLTQLEIPLATVVRLIDFCAENGVPLMLDPAPAIPLAASLLARVTWFTPNETEAEFYAGEGRADDEMLGTLFGMGVRNVILKRGSEGALIAGSDGTRARIDAFRVAALDTTAAGDAFNGAFAVALMRGGSADDCGRFASAAAALSVTRRGAQPSMPNAEEVAAFAAVQRR